METTTRPESSTSSSVATKPSLPPCPLCGEHADSAEDDGSGLIVMRPCGCAV